MHAFGFRFFVFSCLPGIKPGKPEFRALRNSWFERHTARNGQFNLRAGIRTAQHSQSRTDPLCTFTHSRKTPVTFPSRIQYVRIDPATVVAHEYTQMIPGILNFHHDLCRARMSKRVCQPLSPDEINLVPAGSAQLTGIALDDNSKCRLDGRGSFLLKLGKCLFQALL